MKSEKEKMLAGEHYFASDPELRKDFLRAKKLTRLFNATKETQAGRRRKILRELFGARGEKIYG